MGCAKTAQLSTRPAPHRTSEVVFQREAYSVDTLGEVASLSDLIVEGSVASLVKGPIVGQGPDAIGFNELTINVLKVYQGATSSRHVRVLVTGWDPSNGQSQRVEGTHTPTSTELGIWYLHKTQLADQPDAYFVTTTAGQLLRTPAGTVATGGDQRAAAAVCGMSWDRAEALVASSTRNEPPQPEAVLRASELPDIATTSDAIDPASSNACATPDPTSAEGE